MNINLLDLPIPKFAIEPTTALRNLRDRILNETVDRINPIRYASLTTEQQQELIAYRQALLDVPQQAGWPGEIEWPTKPSWL
jgi:hypothetical protein